MSASVQHPQSQTRAGNSDGTTKYPDGSQYLKRPALQQAQASGRTSLQQDWSANGPGSSSHDGSAGTRDRSQSNTDVKEEETQEDGKKSKKRRKVNHACVYCRRSHMTCDQARPCSRCIKRDIGHLCHDEPRESNKRTKSEPEAEEEALSPKQQPAQLAMAGGTQNAAPNAASLGGPMEAMATSGAGDAPMLAPSNGKVNAGQAYNSGDQQTFTDWNDPNSFGFQDIQAFHPQFSFNTSEVTNEYNLLNDFLSNSLLDDAALYGGDPSAAMTDPSNLFTDPSFTNTLGPAATSSNFLTSQTNQLAPPGNTTEGKNLTRPASTARGVDDKATEKYYMTAADPAGTEPPEERMNKLLKAKYDAGLLKPFNYVKGYARLNTYMEKHLHPSSRQKILRQLDAFRPKFRERMHRLTDVELIRVEMWFEMKLMEYDRVFASMAVPACCWRRTGEIFRGNREMAELIDVSVEQLREGKLAIHDIIGEESLVMYWTKFGQIAFDPSKKAMLASCTLKKPGVDVPGNHIRCCFSFTIQRDEHLIPSIIIGNFLPVDAR